MTASPQLSFDLPCNCSISRCIVRAIGPSSARRAMRCLGCGAEMQLTNVAQADAMMIPGFEHHTMTCPVCGDVERRLVFGRREQRAETPVETPIEVLIEPAIEPLIEPILALPAESAPL